MKYISIVLDKDNMADWRDLRCIQCGRKLCNVNKAIQSVYIHPDDVKMADKLDKPMVEIKCRGCDGLYSVLIQ